ncbi:cytochrome c-type biogenesis protein CcmH [Cytobacillus dafuensis]|uniref:Cytochrome c-type biogenesis protein n=1 Tax=Cytobacillus dafuensis TaxID=1742359 RepID=A0A5B8Z778_CYTDA|nr:cytochrome c-type biogenesis protein CcmH [Cytobacillus dafuensis]QED49032.1 hypothetical protein FSZ17_18125 [Cytobacillus dafuensis]
MRTISRRKLIKYSSVLLVSFVFLQLGINVNTISAKSTYTYNSKEFHSVINKLDMQGHADHDISTCTIKKVYYDEVLEALNEGTSEKEILQSYVDEYGQAALRAPGTEGSGMIAWIMPVIGFILGGIGVGYGIKKLTNKNASTETLLTNELPETEMKIIEQTFEEERRRHF